MDYIPNKDSELSTWLKTYKDQIAIVGPQIGLTVAEIKHEQDLCDAMAIKLADVKTAKNNSISAVKAKEAAKQTNIGELRTLVSNHKAKTTFTTALQEKLGVVGTITAFDAANYKTVLTVSIFAGYVRLKFTKNGVEGINIYHRKKGAATWDFLARDTKSPYDDHITLASANPEHWEYRAYGVIDDAEIGLPSDIEDVLFGG